MTSEQLEVALAKCASALMAAFPSAARVCSHHSDLFSLISPSWIQASFCLIEITSIKVFFLAHRPALASVN